MYARLPATQLAEQQKEFKPRGEMVRADIDIEQFNPVTIDFLNLVMLIQSRRANDGIVEKMMRFSSPDFEQELFDDLLRKRNRHLLEEIQTRLAQSKHRIVPWGAAHMPEIAREIQKAGFHLSETKEYVVIQFGTATQKSKPAGEQDTSDNSE